MAATGCGRFGLDADSQTRFDAGGGSAWLSDGFEEPFPGPLTAVSPLVTRVTAPEPVHGGSAAMRASPGMVDVTAVADFRQLPSLVSGDVFMRAYYYFPGTWPIDHVDIAALGPATPIGAVIVLRRAGGLRR